MAVIPATMSHAWRSLGEHANPPSGHEWPLKAASIDKLAYQRHGQSQELRGLAREQIIRHTLPPVLCRL
jgi:hypothetical protein